MLHRKLSQAEIRKIHDLDVPGAIEYFESKGPGVRGLTTQEQVIEALQGYRSMIQRGPRLAEEIKQYLLSHGVTAGDVKPTAAEVFDSRLIMKYMRQGSSTKLGEWVVHVRFAFASLKRFFK